jgi:predicted MFS family arabinose efflux permease
MQSFLLATLLRLVLNTAFRMVYPFLPEFSRGLNLSPDALTVVLSLRGGLGLINSAIISAADRFKRTTLMLAGLGAVMVALGVGLSVPTLWGFAAMLLVIATGKFLFDTGVLALISDVVPYGQRGRAIGLNEMSWAGAALIGLPAVGWLIAWRGWRSPLIVFLGLLAAGAVGLIWQVRERAAVRVVERDQALMPWRAWVRQSGLIAILAVSLLNPMGNEIINVSYARWLEAEYGLSVAALGATAIAFGLAELLGEGVVAGFSDRLGKRRIIVLGTFLSIVGYVSLPLLAGPKSVWATVLALALIYLGFEISIVGFLPLLSEFTPTARARTMSTAGGMQAAGRMLGALIGAGLFPLGMVTIVGFAAILYVILAVLVLTRIRDK